ncbi:MAG TPA: GNAT family protein [Nakamurella sp.]|nr:GNAT family protein [Nakamurella sp.]
MPKPDARAPRHPARCVESWTLPLGVWWDGTLVGSQGLEASNFLITRTAETGSWLDRQHQNRGIGTAMRQAICACSRRIWCAASTPSPSKDCRPSANRSAWTVGERARTRPASTSQRATSVARDSRITVTRTCPG